VRVVGSLGYRKALRWLAKRCTRSECAMNTGKIWECFVVLVGSRKRGAAR
jgi:hypothetical protein